MIAIWKWLQRKWFAPIDLRIPIKQYQFKPGLLVWECNLTTGEIIEAEFEMVNGFDGRGNACVNRKLVMRENCIYEFAINGENAVRKFENRIIENYSK